MRIENRVLPAGPSVPDSVANSVLYYGLLQGIVSRPRPYLWEQMSFATAKDNFYAAARDGLGRGCTGLASGLRFRSRSCSCATAAACAPGSARLGRRRGGCRVLPRDHRGTDPVRMTGADWQIATWRTLIDDHGLDRAEAARSSSGDTSNVPIRARRSTPGRSAIDRRRSRTGTLSGRDRPLPPLRRLRRPQVTVGGGRTRKSWSSSAGPDPHPRCRHGGQPTGAVRRLPPARQRTVRLPGGARGTPARGTSIRSTCGC